MRATAHATSPLTILAILVVLYWRQNFARAQVLAMANWHLVTLTTALGATRLWRIILPLTDCVQNVPRTTVIRVVNFF